jgi:hypothetical protein
MRWQLLQDYQVVQVTLSGEKTIRESGTLVTK